MYLLEHYFCGIPGNPSIKKWFLKIWCIYLKEYYATSKKELVWNISADFKGFP